MAVRAGTRLWPGVRLTSHRGEGDGDDGTGTLDIIAPGVRLTAVAVQ